VDFVSSEEGGAVPKQIEIVNKTDAHSASWSQVLRLSIQLKRIPLPSVGRGPEIKTDFLQVFKNLKR